MSKMYDSLDATKCESTTTDIGEENSLFILIKIIVYCIDMVGGSMVHSLLQISERMSHLAC